MIVAPDLTVAARDCIRDGLATLGVLALQVATKVPNPRPARFLTVEVLGGRKKNLRVASHTVVVMVHDTVANEVACGRLARQVAAALEDANITVLPVTATTVESVFRVDDPAVESACRFQVTVSWTVAYPT